MWVRSARRRALRRLDNLGEEHGHRVLKIRGKGDKTVLIPLPPAVARAIDRAVRRPRSQADPPKRPRRAGWTGTRNPPVKAPGRRGGDSDRPDAPVKLRQTFVTTMLDAVASLRDVQIAARHAHPRTTMRYDRARKHDEVHA